MVDIMRNLLLAAVGCTLLAASVGCSPSSGNKPASSAEKSGQAKKSQADAPKSQVVAAERQPAIPEPQSAETGPQLVAPQPAIGAPAEPPAGRSPTLAPLPAAEFQHPAAVPPSEPLPKPAPEPVDQSIDQPVTAPTLPANPLRDAKKAPPPSNTVTTNAEEEAKESSKAGGRPNIAKNSGVPFDPIKENGPIFEGWPKPKLAMIITGMEEGYIEPCGCAGLDRMKGGMSRRYTLFKQLRQDGWPVVGLDVGGLVHGFGRQAEMKFHTMVEAKLETGYDAIAFGTDDLRMPSGDLISLAAGTDNKPSPFISANASFATGIPAASRLIEQGGMKIGVTAVLGKQYQKEIRSGEIEMTDPAAAVEKVLPELKKAKPDCLVLLAHATMEKTIALAKRFPEFSVVVASDGHPVPPKIPSTSTARRPCW